VNDDPMLTVRGIEPTRPLARVVLDSDLRLPMHSQLVRTIDRGRIIEYCSKEAADRSGTRCALAACGVEIHPISSDRPGRLNLQQVLQHIGSLGVTHLLVEPGPTLAQSFIEQGLWNRAWVFRSPNAIADASAPSAVGLPMKPIAEKSLNGDVLAEYLNNDELLAGPYPSADFLLIDGAVD
jgi:diaminohydroxyphosphoribosylaminopyrimidine deaminase/5-amino-6-(5-phosphoribosylamino)uracil reductase